MPRPALEVADIFRQHGVAYREAHQLPYDQLRVMRAIEICRTAALGGHIEECDHCNFTRHAYNSCRNRHCPKCQSTEREKWLAARKAELLPVEYFHVVFTLPEQMAEIAFYNKETVYDILFRATAETLLTIAGDPQHLGAGIGFFAILHTWGQNLLHHPHLHCVVPGGGLSSDHERWISCLPGFFLPVAVLSQLFRRLFLEHLEDAFYRKQLLFPGSIEPLQNAFAFADLLRSHEERDWVVYAKPPFGGPQRALEYLGRYTHRVAISNHRLLSLEDGHVTFQWKDYRSEHREKSKTMTIDADEFQRRFLIHTVPAGFQRIRHYGFLANCHRKDKLELCRALLIVPVTELLPQPAECMEMKEAITEQEDIHRCPHCGRGSMIRVAVLPCYRWPALPPPDTS
jgi:putative transposase/transposase-like zinc-binding protein